MKTTILLALLLCNSFYSIAETIHWDGEGGDGQWSTAGNWSGNRVPAATDDVVLDNSRISSGYQVNLPGGNTSVSVRSLLISPVIDQQIILLLPAANTSATAFTATGAGNAVILEKGAVFINRSGASSGTPVAVTASNFFRINTGGRYIHRTERGHTINLASRLSTEAGTEYGIFEFDVPTAGFVVSLTGRTYGTLILSATTLGSPVAYTGNGIMPLHINGDLIINSGATLSNGMSADFVIHHDLQVNTAATFNVQNGSAGNTIKIGGNMLVQGLLTETGAGMPVLELNGITSQSVQVTGSMNNSIHLKINNEAGIQLLSPLLISFRLQLEKGKIRSAASSMLVLADNAMYTGGSGDSFVDGPMQKAGDDPQFVFPVGKGGIYAPVGFSCSGMSVTDTMQAEYVRANPQSSYGINYQPGINHISYVEYWKLTKPAGTNLPVLIMLTATTNSFVYNLHTLFVAGYSSQVAQWINHGASTSTAGAASPPYATGTITSELVNALGVFTFGTSDNFTGNPLPLDILAFTVVRTPDQRIAIDWELADCCAGETLFEIQKAGSNQRFVNIARLKSDNNKRVYSTYDNHPAAGYAYYRLKMTDAAGDSSFSRVVIIYTEAKKELSVTVSPAVTPGNTSIYCYSPRADQLVFMLVDMNGSRVKMFKQAVGPGMNSIPLHLQDLASGMYLLSATASNGIVIKDCRIIRR